MFIKTYIPQRVYVSKAALKYPRTQHMISRIKKLNRKALIINIPTNTPPRPNLKGNALYKFLKETIVICVRSAPYMEIFASPGRVSENIGVGGKILSHCPLQCLFCYLDVAGRGTPWTRVYVDIENFYSQAVQERFVYKISLTIWSAISFHLKTPLDKVPAKFKEIVDYTIRKAILQKRSVINTDEAAVKYLKKHLREFFFTMGIKITLAQTAELKKAIPDYYAKNSKNPLKINISEYSDILGLDHITNQMDILMKLVYSDPEFYIEFMTKTANIHNLLNYDGNKQVQVTFNINTPYITNKYEKGVSTLDEMIAAINALMEKGGYEILLAIEPIIKYKGYEEDYRTLIQRIRTEIDLSRVTKIKVGTVRYKTRMKNYINNVHPNSGLLSRNQKLVEPEKEDKRWRYNKEERIKIYSIIKNELVDVPNVALELGSENPELWDELGLNKNDIHSGIVYQYIEEKK